MHGLNGRLIFGQEVSSPCLLSTKGSASLSAASVTDLLTQLLCLKQLRLCRIEHDRFTKGHLPVTICATLCYSLKAFGDAICMLYDAGACQLGFPKGPARGHVTPLSHFCWGP